MCQTRQTTETPLWITPEERCPRGPVALYTTFRAEGVCAGAMLEITRTRNVPGIPERRAGGGGLPDAGL